MRCLPRAVDLEKAEKKQRRKSGSQKSENKLNNADKECSPPVRAPARAGGPGGAVLREEEKEGLITELIAGITLHKSKNS